MNTAIIPLIARSDDGVLRVSSETIAEGAGIEHRAVLQLVAKHMTRLERFGQVTFEMRPGYNNSQIRLALLNEQQATLVMTFMKNTERVIDFKVALVDGFYSMAQELAQPQKTLTNDEIVAQALQITSARVQELEAKVETDAPKVTYVDNFVADNDNHLFRSVASGLNVLEHELRNALMWAGWIYVETQRRRDSKGELKTEYQWSEYSHKKQYFHRSMNHRAPLFKGNVAFTLKITAPGSAAIAMFVKRQVAQHGTWESALSALEAVYIDKKRGGAA